MAKQVRLVQKQKVENIRCWHQKLYSLFLMFIVCTEKKEQKTSNKLGEKWNALKIEINVYYFFVVKKMYHLA